MALRRLAGNAFYARIAGQGKNEMENQNTNNQRCAPSHITDTSPNLLKEHITGECWRPPEQFSPRIELETLPDKTRKKVQILIQSR